MKSSKSSSKISSGNLRNLPRLAAGDAEGVQSLLDHLRWLDEGERVVSAERAGEGNMNLTLRVVTDARTFIVKQSRPWVEKYPQIAAPLERATVEAEYYRRVSGIPGVGEVMPQLLAADDASSCLLLEDLGEGRDLSALYGSSGMTVGGAASMSRESPALRRLTDYLANLHAATRGSFSEVLCNREMRALNHEHIFLVPFAPNGGIALDHLEPGLESLAAELSRDTQLMERVTSLGRRYLEDGSCLVHGDFYPGSWLVTGEGSSEQLWVIDPEFCFLGDPEFDVAVALAHLLLASQGEGVAAEWLDQSFSAAHHPLDSSLVAGFAGTEILRRLLGVAQLPLVPTDGFRAQLAKKAADAVRTGVLASLLA